MSPIVISIRLRLTLLYTGLMALALILFTLLLYGVLRWTFIQAVDSTLSNVAGRVAFQFREYGRLPSLDSLSDRTTFVQVRLADQPMEQSGNFSGLFPLPERATRGTPVYTNEVDSRGEEYRLYTVPILLRNRPLIFVQVAQALALQNSASARLYLPLAVGTVLFVLLGGLAAWWVARKAMEPVNSIARAAQAIGDSADLSLRVPYSGPDDEVGLLVRTFNAMLDQLQALYGRLAAAVDAQQRFVADASHELRTPLTIIRGNLEYLDKAQTLDGEALRDMISEAERMTRLIEELLSTARADAGQAPQLASLHLGPLLSEICRKARLLPHDAMFTAELPEALHRITVLGNSEWLSRAILILVDNAFKYTPSGSVTVRAGRQGDGVVIQVKDTGVGIAPEDLPQVFERFYRADRARSRGGTGLGLSIARWVAGVHGGRVTVESELGTGSTFSLWLPLHREKEMAPPV